jgi:hypothetical protein
VFVSLTITALNIPLSLSLFLSLSLPYYRLERNVKISKKRREYY